MYVNIIKVQFIQTIDQMYVENIFQKFSLVKFSLSYWQSQNVQVPNNFMVWSLFFNFVT